MGAESNANQPLTIMAIREVLKRIKLSAESAGRGSEESRLLWKVGAAVVVGMVCSLRGPEILLLDLGALNAKWKEGKDGTWPEGDPMAPGRNLETAPYVRLELIGEFKNESGTRTYAFHIPPETDIHSQRHKEVRSLAPRWPTNCVFDTLWPRIC